MYNKDCSSKPFREPSRIQMGSSQGFNHQTPAEPDDLYGLF